MEANSEGEAGDRMGKNGNSSSEGQQAKPKRQMKTPFQLESLEKAYAAETYPSEAIRAELSEKLGLTDRQLQMWFCHRRLKDKRENQAKKRRKTAVMEAPVEDFRTEAGSEYGSGSGSGSSPLAELRKAVLDDVPLGKRHYDSPPQSMMELRAVACVEDQLGEPIRVDGPILGMEFDSLPPDAFGAPLASTGEQQKQLGHSYESKIYEQRDAKLGKGTRLLHDYRLLQDPSSIRSDTYGKVAQSHFHDPSIDALRARSSLLVHGDEVLSGVHGFKGHAARLHMLPQKKSSGQAFPSPYSDDECLPQHESSTSNRMNTQFSGHLVTGPENMEISPDGQIFHVEGDLKRKRKMDEDRIMREVDVHDIRMRKEFERQDNLRRKNEERMRKEIERHDRERRKEEERLMREKQKEEERSQREQRREVERREKFLQRESLRAEKMRQKEEIRKEKEAVKLKAALEKATARRIAKESMDLIEDEQLELMELAAKSKGLPSMIHLDHDTLQNLESFRDSLSVFPPKSLQLKKPFSIQPWADSEENVGNLLMVWRFLITFADVLGLWPFTLDELVQSFHDFDSRLLSEIHVSLLKVIIKDIEDVARTPSTGLGANQKFPANPEGGHPQIVEGAYAWGFNICSWQQHLNPLTWPEIFRQLALSAGFGPQLKKRSSAWGYSRDKYKAKGCEDVISTLRSGSAAENAFASMREKGLLLPRRSRHRLTPGTVKFAAFHVLSLEGSKGLTVLELAEKIQKSGLRDLTTSKTPEASISVALTRDTKLFERIAPSTYCVRTPYIKDPADAEAILSSARKKIRIFENGFLGGEDVDVDVEKDEDSECDVDDDAEVDGLATPLVASKYADHCIEEQTCSETGKDKDCDDVERNQNESENLLSMLPMNGSDGTNKPSSDEQCISGKDVETRNLGPESIEIDESNTGESWVQGLTEGEYSYLSVEERLHALVALIGVANEGSSIRAVLEDRLEAANALKKQMWAEAQVDKSRMREDIMKFPLFSGSKAEMKPDCSPEGGQSSLPVVDNNKNYVSPSTVEDPKLLLGSQSIKNHLDDLPTGRASIVQDLSINPDNFSVQQHGFASKRSLSELKSYISHLAEEMYVHRSLPLGQDRRRNRYWQFVASASRNDPCSGRIFVELEGGKWRLIDSEEAFNTLFSSLDTRGIRESHLSVMLQRIEVFFRENVRRNVWCCNNVNESETTIKNETSELDSISDCPVGVDSPSSMVCGLNSDISDASFNVSLRKNEIEEATVERYQDFQKWMWQECFNSFKLCASKYGKNRGMQLLDSCNVCLHCYLSEENHCPNCHQTICNAAPGFSFSEHRVHCEGKRSLTPSDVNIYCSSPLGIRLIKALSAILEASIPLEALASFWTEDYRRSWGATLNVSSSPEELLQILTHLEHAIDRESLSSSFETTKELLGSYGSSQNVVFDSAGGLVSVLPWIPRTTAALALRLFELDAAIIYTRHEKIEPCKDKEVKLFMKLPSKYSPRKNKDVEPKVEHDNYTKEENLADPHSSRSSYRRGRGGHDLGCGTRWQRRGSGLESSSGRQNARENENLNQKLRHQGRRTNRQGYGRGRRTIRRRAERMNPEMLDDDVADETINVETNGQPRRNVAGEEYEEEWDGEIIGTHIRGVGNNNFAEAADSDDNAEAVGYDQVNWEQGFDDVSNKWNENLEDGSDEDIMNVSGDDNGFFEDEGEENLVGEGSDEKTNKVVFDDGSESESESESMDDDYSD